MEKAFEDHHKQVASNDGGDNLRNFFGDIQNKINRSVENSIKDGVYLAPDSSSTSKSTQLVEQLLKSDSLGFSIRPDHMSVSPDGKDSYNKKAEKATEDIDDKERSIAKNNWQALSPKEQEQIKQEHDARELYDMQAIYRSKYEPPATPTLDKFKTQVQNNIADLEKQREGIYHDVWSKLPVEEKASIFRNIENHKTFKAL